jgi:hypothetical protein
MGMAYYRDRNGILRNNFNGGEVREQRPIHTHKEMCPMPDTEMQLRMRGNHPRPVCKHRFQDGRLAWKMSHMQIEGHPAESRRCALCRLRVVMYYEEDV